MTPEAPPEPGTTKNALEALSEFVGRSQPHYGADEWWGYHDAVTGAIRLLGAEREKAERERDELRTALAALVDAWQDGTVGARARLEAAFDRGRDSVAAVPSPPEPRQ